MLHSRPSSSSPIASLFCFLCFVLTQLDHVSWTAFWPLGLLCPPTVGLIRDMSFCLMLSPTGRIAVRSRAEDSENAPQASENSLALSQSVSTHKIAPRSPKTKSRKPEKIVHGLTLDPKSTPASEQKDGGCAARLLPLSQDPTR